MKPIFFTIILLINYFSLSQDGKLSSFIKDVDGNSYKTVTIGKQVWMAENLKTSKYNDGSNIPSFFYKEEWRELKIGAWCYYNNDVANNTKYGKLYNWYALNPKTNGNKNVCPTGWHVPSDNEWKVLTDYLRWENVHGRKWENVGSINSSRNKEVINTNLFNCLPGGLRYSYGDFDYIDIDGYWWSSTEIKKKEKNRSDDEKKGLSVRCLRD